ncbi:MAG TPA: FAD-dependent oxidoreductase [Spirochaetota bacterium]|nr:FAD-dependent oxidoreductase [Spirochaetota bacterium]
MKNNKEYDVIVVGTGAGGSTVAREMTNRGKKVLMLEAGGRWNWMGNTMSVAMVLKYFGLVRSREKHTVTFANNYGGLSNLAAGCAAPPPKSVFGPAGIDLSEEAAEAKKDMWIQEQPDELVGPENLRLLEAANSLGYHWGKMEKFIDPKKCTGNGDCMLGCKTGAKWTARVYGDEAVAKGADLRLNTKIKEVIVEGGKAVGVRGSSIGVPVEYHGKSVVLSAGIDNAYILRKAGIAEAGRGFCCDWLHFVGGEIPGMNSIGMTPMSVGTMEHYESDGIAIVPVFPNWAMFGAYLAFMGPKHLAKFPRFGKLSGIMVKVRDETTGELYKGVSFSKKVTKADRMKLDKGVDIIKKVLRKAGAKDESIIVLKAAGAHPSATCRIGEVVDKNLETKIGNLFCCDASVFPSSLGLPVVWTAVSLGKRLGKHLDARLKD